MPQPLRDRSCIELGLPPEVEQSLRGDRPRRLSGFRLVGKAVQAGVSCREVPEEYWHAACDLERHAQVVVECPCGHRPTLPVGALTKCECQRWFFYAGTEVFALAGTPQP